MEILRSKIAPEDLRKYLCVNYFHITRDAGVKE